MPEEEKRAGKGKLPEWAVIVGNLYNEARMEHEKAFLEAVALAKSKPL